MKIIKTIVRAQEWRNGRETAITVGDGVAMIVIQDASNIGIFVANTEDGRCVEFAGVFIEGIAVLDPRLRAIVIVTHLEVHDPRYRIRTIRGGSAIFQDLHALNGGLDRKSTRLNSSPTVIS